MSKTNRIFNTQQRACGQDLATCSLFVNCIENIYGSLISTIEGNFVILQVK